MGHSPTSDIDEPNDGIFHFSNIGYTNSMVFAQALPFVDQEQWKNPSVDFAPCVVSFPSVQRAAPGSPLSSRLLD
jgi:hypothetical protein